MKKVTLNETEKRVVRAIASGAIPDGGELGIDVADVNVIPAVEALFNGLEGDYRFGMRMLLKIFDFLPFLTIFKFKRFSNLSRDDQVRVLKKWHDSNIYYFRALYIAITSFAYMGFYTDDKVRDVLGYDSHKSRAETV